MKILSVEDDVLRIDLPTGKTQEELVLKIELPTGKTQEELVSEIKKELEEMDNSLFFGKDIKINGHLTTGMALVLGHHLAHITTNSVSIFDPKLNRYIEVIKH